MNPSQQQVEARTSGTQESTVRFLANHHLIAILVFALAIVTANLWAEVVISGYCRITNKKREDLDFVRWIILAAVFTLFAYIMIVYVFKMPITAAFTF